MGKVGLGWLHVDAVVLVCLAALFGFPIAAAIVADGQPVDPKASARAPAGGRGAPLQDLPAFSAGSALARRAGSLLADEERMNDALLASLTDLLGTSDAASAMRVVRGAGTFEEARDRLVPDLRLGGVPDRMRLANDVGALLLLAAAAEYGDDAGGGFPGAPDLAFELLDQARRSGACVPQRNLAFLASTDPLADRDAVASEFRRAARSCPRDLTHTWMLGQYDSREATFDSQARRRAIATFRSLQRRFPGSPLGWSGEADTLLRLGYDHEEQQRPFTARAHFRRALLLYRRARQFDGDPGLAAGAARAHAGLREYDRAIREQRRALADRAALAPLAVRHVDYLERDHRFKEAAAAARRLIRTHEFASGRSLIGGEPFRAGDLEDTTTPLSVGVDRMRPVTFRLVRLRPPPTPQAGAGGGGFGDGGPGALDLSFIPQFEDIDGLTGETGGARPGRWHATFL